MSNIKQQIKKLSGVVIFGASLCMVGGGCQQTSEVYGDTKVKVKKFFKVDDYQEREKAEEAARNNAVAKKTGEPPRVEPSTGPTSVVEDNALPVDLAWARLRAKVASEKKRNSTWGAMHLNGIPLANFMGETNRAQADAAKSAMNGKLSVDAFDEMVDQLAQYLARELPLNKQIAKAQTKQVLAMAAIENRSKTTNSALDAAMDDLATRLLSSEGIKNNFVVLDRQAPKFKEALDAAGAGKPWKFGDALAGGGGNNPAGFGEYDPDTIYEVTGKFYQVSDEGRHRMFLKTLMEVWKPRTGETNKAHEFSREYRFHPYRKQWITAEADEALRAEMKTKTAMAK